MNKLIALILSSIFLVSHLNAETPPVVKGESVQMAELEAKYHESKFKDGICYLHRSQLVEKQVPINTKKKDEPQPTHEEELKLFPFASEDISVGKIITDKKTGLPSYALVRVCLICENAKEKWVEEKKKKEVEKK